MGKKRMNIEKWEYKSFYFKTPNGGFDYISQRNEFLIWKFKKFHELGEDGWEILTSNDNHIADYDYTGLGCLAKRKTRKFVSEKEYVKKLHEQINSLTEKCNMLEKDLKEQEKKRKETNESNRILRLTVKDYDKSNIFQYLKLRYWARKAEKERKLLK